MFCADFLLSALVMSYEAQQVVIEKHNGFHLRPIAKDPLPVLVLFYLQVSLLTQIDSSMVHFALKFVRVFW